jgi:hypothetical protein
MNMLPSYWQSGAWKWMPVVFGEIIEPSKSGPGWQKATAPFKVLGELSKE